MLVAIANGRGERADFKGLEKMLAGRIQFSIIDNGMGREICKTVVRMMFMVEQDSSPRSWSATSDFLFSFLKICGVRPERKTP